MSRRRSVPERRKEKGNEWELEENLDQYLLSLPKVELHVHLDGSFDPSLLRSHLEDTGLYDCLPEDNPVRKLMTTESGNHFLDFHCLCTCRGKRSFQAMVDCFQVFIPIVRGNLSLLEKLAYDFVKRQADQTIIYSEVRYSPHFLADGGSLETKENKENEENTDGNIICPEPVIDAITSGLRRGERDFGVKVNQILCCMSCRPDWANEIVQIAHKRRNDWPCAIVGVDIAAGEEHFDKDKFPHLHRPHFKAFQTAKKLKLPVTLHAGEVGDISYIKKAVDHYGARRIGHGYRVIDDKQLMQEMKNSNVHFEVCPTSSVETGGWDYDEKNWEEHPAVMMVRNGMRVGFNTDNPAVFDTSLTWQLRIAICKMGLGKECLSKMVYDSISAAFISDVEKENLRRIVRSFEEKEESKEYCEIV